MQRRTVLTTGLCAPARRRYAGEISVALAQPVITASALPRDERDRLLEHTITRARDSGDTIVVDTPTDADLPPLLDAVAGEVVCLVDARRLLDDLRDRSALAPPAHAQDDRGDVGARARHAAHLVECASLVVFIDWEGVETSRLSVMMAVVSHLNPTARIRLSRSATEDLRALAESPPGPAWRERAGWVHALNDEHTPFMRDPRVVTVRYEQLRPFHPARLAHQLDVIDAGTCGTLVRSVGFCRLATRPGVLARWEQAGSAMWLDPLEEDEGWRTTVQEIAFTGIDLDVAELTRRFDDAALTDAELAAGPAAWEQLPDPLPPWPATIDESGN
ncbi:GTP-binding protein [Microbacterium xanthum]|uniref:GTP-binding protein n=1 Tax=Microbacterium xanthum TaxID=3079794 RepID=UPI002AD450A4|nr:GTP-binding protein [Microbacterium sp. KSW-48]MDZ8172103.1 GTP-binding protein [Microbacterium sp. KSW-48]